MLEDILKTGVVGKKKCPICDSEIFAYLPFGAILRKNAQCPNCRTMERHRALWLYFEKHTSLFSDDKLSDVVKLLHFAPEKVFFDKFRSLNNIDYYPVDINPSNKLIRDTVDIQSIKYQDAMFDVIICNDVLEHVPRDHDAMRELCRVLKKDGVAYIHCPVFNIETTIENPSYNTPELRLRHYGQEDHLRRYGNDFAQKLTNARFVVESVDMTKDLTEAELQLYGLTGNEVIFKCKT
jgi:SAM-dependent methyltransferase